jgi:assimilatory nitrate reductase catalytic subunit
MICGLYLVVGPDGRITGVEPRTDDPINKGRLCEKGLTCHEMIHHPDRLKKPLIKKDGKFAETTWDKALDLIAKKFQGIAKAHGPNAIGCYGSARITNEKAYLFGKFARVAIGTRHIDGSGRLCMASAAAAYLRTFGADRSPNPWSDILLADCIIIVGSNTAETHPVMMTHLFRAKDRGATIIVIDPRVTHVAIMANIHLQLKPGTDLALLNSLLHVIVKEDLIDRDFIRKRTKGFETVEETIKKYTPEKAEEITGVPADKIVQAAISYGRAKTGMILFERGPEHQIKGVNNVLSILNIAMATGKIGKPGCGPCTITGQPNGQGAREMGQLTHQLPGERLLTDPEARKHIAKVWGIPIKRLPDKPGYTAVEMFDAAAKGEIKDMYIFATNPMVSLPDLNYVKTALEKLEFLVVQDMFPSETAEFADVVLPGSCWAEEEGTMTNIEGRCVKLNKVVDPPGEAMEDWKILCAVAKSLGAGRYFTYKSPVEIFNEIRLATKGAFCTYAGMTYKKVEDSKGIFWPCPDEAHPGTPRLYEERFATKDGLGVFHPVEYTPAAEQPDDLYPLILTTVRSYYHFLSGTQTRRTVSLTRLCPEPYIEINPETALKLGIKDGDLISVRSRRGEAEFKARVTLITRPDVVAIPYHWGIPQAANLLTIGELDPVSRIPEYKICSVAIERVKC